METSPEINEIAKALSNVQQEALLAIKDANNPFFKSKYADLSSVWGVLRGPLSENGLSVAQPLGYAEDGSPIVYTLLMHVSGQWIKGECRMRPEKDTPQALGSCVTYSRRYSLAAMCGVCPEDDDAEHATNRRATPAPRTPQKPPQAPRQNTRPPEPPPKKNTVTDDPGFPPKNETKENVCTVEQINKLYEIGANGEVAFTDREVNQVCNWFKVGEKLSYVEAEEMIKGFSGIVDRYVDYISEMKT